MVIDLDYIKTILIYISVGLFVFSFFISVVKSYKHVSFSKYWLLFLKHKSVIQNNSKKLFYKPKQEKQIFSSNSNETNQPIQNFDMFFKEVMAQKEQWLLTYTPFFRFDNKKHKYNIERFFLNVQENKQIEKFLIFWQQGYHPPSWTALLVFYSAATNKNGWQQFLIENLKRKSLPTSERLLLQFLFQDVLNDSILWQELYYKRAIIFNKSFRFNIELLFNERKWTSESFPHYPFDLEQPNQEEKFYQLFHFLQNDLEKKCNVFIFRKLQEAYPNYNRKLLNEIFNSGNYTALNKIADSPSWTKYFLSPNKFFPQGKITVEDFYHLRKQTNKIPFGDYHLLFLLYRIAPQSFLVQKISLNISDNWIKKIENKEKEIPSPFIRFVEYLYALQTHQERLAQRMQVYLNTKTPKNIVFISRALAAGGRSMQAQRAIEEGLKEFGKDPLLLQESALYVNIPVNH